MSAPQRRIVILSCISLLAFGLMDNLRGPFLSHMLEGLELTDSEGAFYFAITSLMASLTSWRGGVILRRWGALGALQLGLVLMFAGYVGIALSKNLPGLLLAAGIFGSGLGLTGLGQNVGVSEVKDERLRRKLLGVLHSMYALASLMAPLATRYFLLSGLGWRSSFLIVSMVPLVLVFIGGWPRREHQEAFAADEPKFLKYGRRDFFFFALAISAYLLAEISLATRMVIYIERVYNLPTADAAVYLAVFFVLFLLARLLMSSIDFALKDRHLLFLCLLISFGLVGAGLLFSPWWLALSGLSLGPFYPLAISEAKRVFKAQSSQALSYVLGLGSLSVVSMHLMIGWLSDQYGIGMALWIGPLGLILSGFTFWAKSFD